MADENTERQELIANMQNLADNLNLRLTGLLTRAATVEAQTDDETIRDSAVRILDTIDGDIDHLSGLREGYTIAGHRDSIDEFISGVQEWCDYFHESIEILAREVDELEEQAGSHQQVNDLVAAVITQQQIDDERKKACSVCLEDFKLEESVKKCSACHNSFHGNCMQTWLLEKHNCPYCRSILRI